MSMIIRVNESEATETMRELRENEARINSVVYADGKAIIYYN